MADKADPHALYEEAVQDAAAEVDFVEATFKTLRGRPASLLREDFCGTANVSCEWVRRRAANRAAGIDLDASVLAWAARHHVGGLKPAQRARVRLIAGDVLRVRTPPQDIVLAMNFSYWTFKSRSHLRDYFARVRAGLVPDGVFMLDCYGGYDAFRILRERKEFSRYTYLWDQASYNPITGDLECHIHFRFKDGSRLDYAFSYAWRLWTLPELREVLSEAGFKRVIVYWQGWDEKTDDGDGNFAPAETADPDAGWIAYIAALK